MTYRSISLWMFGAIFVSASLPLLAAEYNDDFANGIDPSRWEVILHAGAVTVDDSGGDLHFIRPERGDFWDSAQVCYTRGIIGDFDISFDFSGAELDDVIDEWGNHVSLEVTFGGVFFALARNGHGEEGQVVSVWVDPPGIWPFIPESATEGRLRITRYGEVVTGYFNDTVVHTGSFNDGWVNTFCLNIGTEGALSVHLDNATLISDDDYGPGPVCWNGNHHCYEVANERLHWPDARAAAENRSWLNVNGHLATITSQEESDFIYSAFGGRLGGWLGGYQDPPDDPDPGANWHWVTDEPWQYTNWRPGEPNGGDGAEFYLGYHGSEIPLWNDSGDVADDRWLVEYPTTASQSGNAAVTLPAVARVQGAGAFFTSKWNLFNSSEDDLVVSMTYTPRVDFGGPPQTVQYTVPGGELQEITDPLLEIFGIPDDAVGSVIMEVPDGSIDDLMVQSVVFAQQDDGSEFGQFFPARGLADAIQAGDTAYLTTTEDPAHNRVNLGMMAAKDGTRIKVTPVDPIGTSLADPRQFNLNFARSRQVNNIHGAFGLGNRPDVLLEVEVLDGSALVYGSVVDGKGTYAGTSDPTTIQPVSNGAFNVILLELGPVSGYNEFSGSASITNHSPNPAEVTVEFCDRSAPGIAASSTLTLAPGETLGYGDIVGDLIGLENSVGTVMLSSGNGTLLSATGREFAVFKDGDGNVTGTAGQLMEGLTGEDILNPGKTHHFIGLRQVESGDSLERSHMAFFNPGSSPVQARMSLYADDGGLEGTWTRSIRAMELVHVNNIINRINSSQDGEVKRLEVTVNGPLFARAFRVNPYGDPITIEPFTR